jgi:hypothetical protein
MRSTELINGINTRLEIVFLGMGLNMIEHNLMNFFYRVIKLTLVGVVLMQLDIARIFSVVLHVFNLSKKVSGLI